MRRTELYADPAGISVHDLILQGANRFGDQTALVDASHVPPRRIGYAEYADIVTRLAAGVSAAGLRAGEVVAIFLPTCWQFAAAYDATTSPGHSQPSKFRLAPA